MAPPTIPQPPPKPPLRCEVLGQASIVIGETRLALEGELVFGLALYLALNAGTEISRDAVAQLLWPTHDDDAARHCLRQLVYRLRALGLPLAPSGEVLDLSTDQVCLDVSPLFTPEPSRAAYLEVSRFDVLADYAPAFSPRFARWVEQVREQFGVRLRNGLMACIADARSRGRYREVSQLATHCLALDPLNEEATLGLAEATALAGNKVRALQMLEAYRLDLGASPSLSLQTDLLRRRISERLNVYSTQSDDVPMIGRDDAVEYLLRGVHALSSGTSQTLLIVGEPGLGKTRLLTEFQRIVAVHGVRTVTLRCHPGWEEQPLTAITDLATTLLQLPGALGCSPDAMAALRELTAAVPRRSDAALYATDADSMLANLRWAVLDLFEAVIQEHRLVLLVDNVQWLDSLSERFLEYVFQRCAKKPLYVVMTARDEEGRLADPKKRPLLATEHRLILQPLDDVQARTLVRQVVELTDRSLPDSAVEDCIRRCGGNPYFLSEIARFFLVAGPGAAAPVTLRTFIEFRLTKVSQAARRALQVVAILGAFSNIGRVRRVLQLSGYSVLNALEELQLAGLLHLENELCECRHDVVREVSEAGMSGVARRMLHLRAAREFKKEAVSSKEPALLFECGRHLLKSGDTERAPRGALILANRLLELGAAEGAEELARSALERTTDGTVQARACLTTARSLRVQGKWRELAALRAFVLDAERSLFPILVRTEILIHSAEAIVQLNTFSASDLDDLAALTENVKLPWFLRLQAARLAITVADNKWNVALANRVAPIIESSAHVTGTEGVLSKVSKVILSTMMGRHEEACQLADRLACLVDSDLTLAMQHLCVRVAAHCFFRTGELARARALFGESLKRSTNAGRYYYATLDHLFLALVSVQDGDITDAKGHLSEARALAEKTGFQSDMLLGIDLLASEVAAEAGEVPNIRTADYRRIRAEAIELDPRVYQSLLALRLLQISMSKKVEAAIAIRRELADAIERFRGCGWQDFPVFALAKSFEITGDASMAHEVLRHYLAGIRTERSRLRPSLSALALRLGITLPQHVNVA